MPSRRRPSRTYDRIRQLENMLEQERAVSAVLREQITDVDTGSRHPLEAKLAALRAMLPAAVHDIFDEVAALARRGEVKP